MARASKISKQAMKTWLARIREDCADAAFLINTPGQLTEAQLDELEELMNDASGAACQLVTDMREGS